MTLILITENNMIIILILRSFWRGLRWRRKPSSLWLLTALTCFATPMANRMSLLVGCQKIRHLALTLSSRRDLRVRPRAFCNESPKTATIPIKSIWLALKLKAWKQRYIKALKSLLYYYYYHYSKKKESVGAYSHHFLFKLY